MTRRLLLRKVMSPEKISAPHLHLLLLFFFFFPPFFFWEGVATTLYGQDRRETRRLEIVLPLPSPLFSPFFFFPPPRRKKLIDRERYRCANLIPLSLPPPPPFFFPFPGKNEEPTGSDKGAWEHLSLPLPSPFLSFLSPFFRLKVRSAVLHFSFPFSPPSPLPPFSPLCEVGSEMPNRLRSKRALDLFFFSLFSIGDGARSARKWVLISFSLLSPFLPFPFFPPSPEGRSDQATPSQTSAMRRPPNLLFLFFSPFFPPSFPPFFFFFSSDRRNSMRARPTHFPTAPVCPSSPFFPLFPFFLFFFSFFFINGS